MYFPSLHGHGGAKGKFSFTCLSHWCTNITNTHNELLGLTPKLHLCIDEVNKVCLDYHTMALDQLYRA